MTGTAERARRAMARPPAVAEPLEPEWFRRAVLKVCRSNTARFITDVVGIANHPRITRDVVLEGLVIGGGTHGLTRREVAVLALDALREEQLLEPPPARPPEAPPPPVPVIAEGAATPAGPPSTAAPPPLEPTFSVVHLRNTPEPPPPVGPVEEVRGLKAAEPAQPTPSTTSARTLAALGVPVLPLWPIKNGRCACPDPACPERNWGKHPFRGGVYSATTDVSAIDFGDCNVGVAMGNGWLIIDKDIPTPGGHIEDGRPTIAEFEARLGELPPTVEWFTGSGGEQALYHVPVDLEVAKKLGPGVDLKGQGGYGIAPPSNHRSGGTYRYKDGRSPTEHEVAELPKQWLEALAQGPKAKATPLDLNEFQARPRADAAKLAKARAKLVQHGPAVEGRGGDTHTFRAACIVLRDEALPADQALELLEEWNRTCRPPWDVGDLETKLANAASYGSGADIDAWAAAFKKTFSKQPPIDTDPKAPPDTWEGRLHRAKMALESRAAPTATAAPKPRPARTLKELNGLLPRRAQWLVDGILPRESVFVVGGEPKSDKTWSVLELALTVAAGGRAFGEFLAGGPTEHVYLMLVEDDQHDASNRMRALFRGRGLDPNGPESERVHLECRQSFNLQSDVDLISLVATCWGLPKQPGLLALDPLRDVMTAEENEAGPMSDVMGRLRWLRDTLGCSVVFVHHSAKASRDTSGRRGGQKLRGSSVVHGAVDGGLYLTHGGQHQASADVELKAFRSAGDFELTLTIDDGPDGRATKAVWSHKRADAKALSAEVEAKVLEVLRAQQPLAKRALATKAGLGEPKVDDALTELAKRGLVTSSPRNGGVVWSLTKGATP